MLKRGGVLGSGSGSNVHDDNTILLSHLSLKRKEFIIERFEYIFTDFDKHLKNLKDIDFQYNPLVSDKR